MEKQINQIQIYYQDIFLKNINLTKKVSIKDIMENFETEIKPNYILSIPNINHPNILKCNILYDYLFNNKFLGISFSELLSEEDFKIITYLGLLEFLTYSSFVDKSIPKGSHQIPISFSSIIAERNLEILKNLFIAIKNKQQLIANFLLRDIIENIKLYLFFICGSKKEETINNQCGTFTREVVSKDIDETIISKLSKENQDWKFNIKDIIENNKSLMIWNDDLSKIEKLNNRCNSNIHKNGLFKILPNAINYATEHITIADICFCVRFFVTLITCYDGKELSASDYLDYLEFNMQPPENSQYWIAPICLKFIHSEYNKEEIEKLKSMTYMDLDYIDEE